jgi:hypothetical protein
MYNPIDLLLLLLLLLLLVSLTRVEQGRAIPPHAFNTEGEGKMCITYCWNVLSPKNFPCCMYLRLQIVVWSRIANPVNPVTWGHHAVCEEWILLQIRTGDVYIAATCHCRFTSKLNSYFHASSVYAVCNANLVWWHQLNNQFYWLS